MKKKKAFTLAEVLITLTIIGVIAAITVPVVMTNQKDAVLTAQFKKTYASMYQALNKTIMLDFGGSIECHYHDNDNHTWAGYAQSQCGDFYEAFAKNLNLLKTCNGNAKADGCVPEYNSSSSAAYQDGGGCMYFSKSNIENADIVYTAADGQILILFGGNPASLMPVFAVDINGMKGPNKGGYDLFAFNIRRNISDGSYSFTQGGCIAAADGGRSTAEMLEHAFAGKE